MTVSITVRNVPDYVRDVFAERAAASGQSMQEYLAGALTRLAERPDPADWLVAAQHVATMGPPVPRESILAAIAEGRRM